MHDPGHALTLGTALAPCRGERAADPLCRGLPYPVFSTSDCWPGISWPPPVPPASEAQQAVAVAEEPDARPRRLASAAGARASAEVAEQTSPLAPALAVFQPGVSPASAAVAAMRASATRQQVWGSQVVKAAQRFCSIPERPASLRESAVNRPPSALLLEPPASSGRPPLPAHSVQ